MNKRAFTLVELSVSIVIIGLLAGFIISAISVVQAAEVRKIISEYNNYRTAILSFKLQYNQFPGDFDSAYSYWASDCASSSCNGNGNGIIEYTTSLSTDESIRAWQHLSLSGFLPGSYTGVRTVTGENAIGTNVPNSQIFGAGWAFYNTQAYTTNNLNTLIFGGYRASRINDSSVISTQNAYSIDSKIDDGQARLGSIRGLYSDDLLGNYATGATTANACVQNSASSTTDIAKSGYYYINLKNDNLNCALQFLF